MTRPPSPAETRNHLDPAAVDALAHQLHTLSCIPLCGPDTLRHSPRHTDYDRGRARFLLMGLHDTGWTLTPAP